MEQTTKTALLVMDVQLPIVGLIADPSPLLSNLSKAIAYARENSIPIIYVVVGFREGAPEISANNKGFSAFGKKDLWTPDFSNHFTIIHPNVAPQEGDITVTKRRVSAFTGSDLEVVLRAYGVQHLVLTGIATSGVVLSTLREASDKDFQLTVIEDCCADADQEVHRLLITKVFSKQAEVLTLEQWVK